MNLRLALSACLALSFLVFSHAEPAQKDAELYSWRTTDGTILYGIRVDKDPLTAEILLEDKKYQIATQADLAKALEKLGPGQLVSWHHLSQKGKATLPPEEIEVETKETAMKSKVTLVIWEEKSLDPEYWNQPRGAYETALKKLETATDEADRFHTLRTVAKEAFALGLYPEAKKYATELEALTPKMKEDWNYGDAIQDSNLILGRIAMKEGDIDTAKGCLLGAGYSPGSPVMNTLGPDMSLARDLLAKGERSIVLDYLDLCRNFWKTDHGLIDQWYGQIKNGKTPDFGTNARD